MNRRRLMLVVLPVALLAISGVCLGQRMFRQPGVIPEDYLERMIGQHMLEGHLAYMLPEELERH